ncbi:hypothetical protein F5B19DRAFT_491179 [Rostrohypoxylon terebratum]|nr:hypothetical protein F5B19DRAFT_491179 [Rostrohypoxylon terebratum]
MEENSPASAPVPIPTRTCSQNQGTAQTPAKQQRYSLLQLAGRSFSMPTSYRRSGFPGTNSSGPRSSSSFTPQSRSGLVSPNGLVSPVTSPESQSPLDSVKEPEPQSVSIACPRALPGKVRFPLIDSYELDSPMNDGAAPSPSDVASGTTAYSDEEPASEYETDEEEWSLDNQSAYSVALTGSVTRGEIESIDQNLGTPKSEEGSIIGIPPFPISRETGQNIRFHKTHEEYVKYLIDKIRKSHFRRGCTMQEWIDDYPNVKAIVQEVADNVYGILEEDGQEQEAEGYDKTDKGDKQAIADDKAKKCQAKGHQPTLAIPSFPQPSVTKGRKFVTRIFKKIKSLFKKNEPVSQVYEMPELRRKRRKVDKGKGREIVEERPAPARAPERIPTPTTVAVGSGDDAEESADDEFVKVEPATTPRRSWLDNRVGYREERGETSAQGAKMYCLARRLHPDSGFYSFVMVGEGEEEEEEELPQLR